jgi:hypothetical protein
MARNGWMCRWPSLYFSFYFSPVATVFLTHTCGGVRRRGVAAEGVAGRTQGGLGAGLLQGHVGAGPVQEDDGHGGLPQRASTSSRSSCTRCSARTTSTRPCISCMMPSSAAAQASRTSPSRRSHASGGRGVLHGARHIGGHTTN